MLQKNAPDIASQGVPAHRMKLSRVGMAGIEVPTKISLNGKVTELLCRADAYVSLDEAHVKGIHMSRLFLALQSQLAAAPISFALLQDILAEFLQSHHGISHNAYLTVQAEVPLQRKALLSDNYGVRGYPVIWHAQNTHGKKLQNLQLSVTYSSTCPCSAALARQLIQDKFRQDFKTHDKIDAEDILDWLGSEEGIMATPHGQRSQGRVSLNVDPTQPDISLVQLIDHLEKTLGTPVQTAVKREDEQEFARLNGKNLMFAEDAARKMAAAVEAFPQVLGYRAEAIHYESLHPHDAVAVVEKNYQN